MSAQWQHGQVSNVRTPKGRSPQDLPQVVEAYWPIGKLQTGRKCVESQLLESTLDETEIERNLKVCETSMRIALREQGIRARIVVVKYTMGEKEQWECRAGSKASRGGWTHKLKTRPMIGYACLVYDRDILDGKSNRSHWWIGITSTKDEDRAQEGWTDRAWQKCVRSYRKR